MNRYSVQRVTQADRIVVGVSGILGIITCAALVCGYFDWHLNSAVGALGILMVGVLGGLFLGGRPTFGRTEIFVGSTVWIVPSLFLLAGLRWFLQPADIRLGWLFETWDGTTNSGLVTLSRVLGNIGRHSAVITQWETYPRAPHFVLGEIARVCEIVGLGTAADRVTIYAIGLWLTYAALLLAVGALTVRLGQLIGGGARGLAFLATISQSALIVPALLNKTLFLHSLSFLMCVVTCISLTLLWIELSQKSSPDWRSASCLVLHVVLIIETFPLVFVFPVAVFALFLRRFGWAGILGSKHLVLAVSIPVAIATPRLIDQVHAALETDHVAMTGHLLAFSMRTVQVAMVIGVLGIVVLFRSKGTAREVSILMAGALLVPVVAWVMVGNFDRTYGVNYYPKKVEFFAFYYLVATAPLAVFCLRKATPIFRSRFPLGVATAVSTVVLALWIGPATEPRVVSTQNPARRYLVQSLEEAQRPGQAIIFGKNAELSAYASMFSNLNDRTFWDLGYLNDRLVTIFQQVSTAKSDAEAEDFCQIVRGGLAVIVDLRQGVRRTACGS